MIRDQLITVGIYIYRNAITARSIASTVAPNTANEAAIAAAIKPAAMAYSVIVNPFSVRKNSVSHLRSGTS